MKDYDIAVCFGDLHIPLHDQTKTRILLDIIEDIKPDMIIDLGDTVNATQISNHPKTHSQLTGLQDELRQAWAWFESINKVSKKSKKIMCKCNHFFNRVYNKILKENYGLSDLDVLKPENLLKLEDYGWTAVEEYVWKDVLLFSHGDNASGSSASPVNTARRLVRENGITIVRGHSHSTGFELYKRFNNSIIASIQLGTFHADDKIDYIKNSSLNNWTHSFAVFYLNKNTSEFFFQVLYFVDNKILFNGKVYK